MGCGSSWISHLLGGYQAVMGNEFAETQYVEGIDRSDVTYNAETGVLLLGDPLVITPENVNDYNF